MQNSALDIWIAGAVAVVTVDFLVYPFDTLKTRIQSPNYNTIYKDATTNTVRKNVLFRGLYQGVFSVVLSTIPASGAFFTTYENVKATLNKTKSKSNSAILQATPAPMINAASSSAGEMVSCLLLTPAEVIKQNAQVIHNTPGGKGKGKAHPGNVTLQVLSRFRRHPWKLWSGYTALVGRNLPSTGVNFPIFEAVKGYLVDRRRRRLGYNTATNGADTARGRRGIQEEPVFERAVLTGVAASISGSIASVVTTPIDVVKTRMMLAAASDSSSGASTAAAVSRGKGNSIWAVGGRIFREEGVRGLFRGGAIRVVWTAISFCIYLSMYEGGRFYLEKRRAMRAELDNS